MSQTDDQTWADFTSALGESFSYSICPPVPDDDASAQECCNAVWQVLGKAVTPTVLANLSTSQISELAAGIGAYFESETPTGEQIRDAIARTLVRWPVGSLGDW
jgi:hypothetical protein